MHASLVMQDKETDSYWSIMTGDAMAGELKGTRLEELSHGTKAQWKDWKAKHPETLILSVEGVEHIENSPYDNYFSSPDGFRGVTAADERLPTKEAIYAFQIAGKAFAIPYSETVGGTAFETPGSSVFLYRPEGAALFASTLAYQTTDGSFEKKEGTWRHVDSGAIFDPEQRRFATPTGETIAPLSGFDTFWFNWSMTHPESEILKAVQAP